MIWRHEAGWWTIIITYLFSSSRPGWDRFAVITGPASPAWYRMSMVTTMTALALIRRMRRTWGRPETVSVLWSLCQYTRCPIKKFTTKMSILWDLELIKRKMQNWISEGSTLNPLSSKSRKWTLVVVNFFWDTLPVIKVSLDRFDEVTLDMWPMSVLTGQKME